MRPEGLDAQSSTDGYLAVLFDPLPLRQSPNGSDRTPPRRYQRDPELDRCRRGTPPGGRAVTPFDCLPAGFHDFPNWLATRSELIDIVHGFEPFFSTAARY